MEQILKEYAEVLNQQKLETSDLDYSAFEKQIPFLNQMSTINNSGVSVFDFHQKEHIYSSFNFSELLGFDLAKVKNEGTKYFDSKVHPDDLISNIKNGILLMTFFFSLPVEDRKNYKFQNEYRVLNSENKYIRIIEQHQVLELDKKGNIWLAISILDISPNQDNSKKRHAQLLNVKTGEHQLIARVESIPEIGLSKREKEILSLVKKGLFSKEISDSLSISVHTVNTHRQNILKKLSVDNSIEAIEYATKRNLV